MSAILTLHDPDRAAQYYANGYWKRETLYALLQQNARCDQIACVARQRAALDVERSVQWVDRVALDLHTAACGRVIAFRYGYPIRAETVLQ